MRKIMWLMMVLFPVVLAAQPGGVAEVDRYLQREFEKNAYPGLAVALVKDGRILLAKGYGMAQLPNRRMTPETVMGIGSITKSLTAASLMQLVDEGSLRLEDRVVDHLPWFRTVDKEKSDRITVGMLLDHSSGLPSQDRDILAVDNAPGADQRFAKSLAGTLLNREPGSSFEYSNEGYVLAGLVGAKLRGMAYADYMKEHLLKPLEMDDAGIRLNRRRALNAIPGHWQGVDQGLPAQYGMNTQHYAAAGMLHTSVTSMGRYLIALLNNGRYQGKQILSAASVRAMWTPRTAMPERADGGVRHYGLGWMLEEVDGRRLVMHGGTMTTMTAMAMMEPGSGAGIVILSPIGTLNPRRFTPLSTLANNALHRLHGEALSNYGRPTQPDATRNNYTLPRDQWARFTGHYTFDGFGNSSLTISDTEEGLLGEWVVNNETLHRFRLDFANPVRAYSRHIAVPASLRFLQTMSGDVYGVLYRGHRFHRQARGPAPALTRLPGGGMGFVAPEGWRVNLAADHFTAQSPQAGVTITGGRTARQSLEDQAAAWIGEEEILFSGHVNQNTISRVNWRQQTFQTAADDKGRQRMLCFAHANGGAWYLTLETPDGQLSKALQDHLMPLMTSLVLAD